MHLVVHHLASARSANNLAHGYRNPNLWHIAKAAEQRRLRNEGRGTRRLLLAAFRDLELGYICGIT
jgi:hypothetical protein